MLKKLVYIGVCIAVFMVVHYQAIMEGNAPKPQFTDVGEQYSWAADAIGELSAKEIISGMEEGKFEPGTKVKREQLAKMLALAFGADTQNQSVESFVDVPQDRWSFAFVEATKDWMVRDPELPINQYNPAAECTREEVAASIMKACGLGEKENAAEALSGSFTDADGVSDYLKGMVAAAVEKGLLQGDAGTLRPGAQVTRAEAAVFLSRGMKLKEGGAIASSTPAPSAQPQAATQTPIVGDVQITVEQAKKWAESRGADQRYIDAAELYWKYGKETGIRPEVLYGQAAKETNFGKYTGNVKPEQNNWAGIKTVEATGDRTEDHETFPTPDDGVRAHFNHMAAYVGKEPVGEPHGRYAIVKSTEWAGTVKNIEELGGKWAPEPTYGQDLIQNYLNPMLAAK